jgi:asparagine synthase (glutamine-hydrolysing)
MCGIAGIYEYQQQRPISPELLQHMTDVIQHRGPDDAGSFLSGPIALGMRRLSIIDLEGGKQPISNETREVTLVFNGEIYNFRDLQEQLVKRGHLMRTASDTEVRSCRGAGSRCSKQLLVAEVCALAANHVSLHSCNAPGICAHL